MNICRLMLVLFHTRLCVSERKASSVSHSEWVYLTQVEVGGMIWAVASSCTVRTILCIFGDLHRFAPRWSLRRSPSFLAIVRIRRTKIDTWWRRQQERKKQDSKCAHESRTVGVAVVHHYLACAALIVPRISIEKCQSYDLSAICYDASWHAYNFVVCRWCARVRSLQRNEFWMNPRSFSFRSILSIGWLDLDHMIAMSVVCLFCCFVSADSELWCVPRRHLFDTTLNINSDDLRHEHMPHTYARPSNTMNSKSICIADIS